MSDRRSIFSLCFRLAVAATGITGLVLLLLPGIARGLGRQGELAPWALSRRESSAFLQEQILSEAGLRVSPKQLKRNRNQWAAMSEGRRLKMLDRLGRLQQLDSGQRAKLVRWYKRLRQMPPAERERMCRQGQALARFEASLGRQDLAVLDGLSGQARARHLVKLWQTHQGL
ncbi:MAG: DUF3106 domain-containing protein [Anaerolineaceae bacterium]|nr:DUF3106 domain-containing protein [Anaerolineaceae bacterium]